MLPQPSHSAVHVQYVISSEPSEMCDFIESHQQWHQSYMYVLNVQYFTVSATYVLLYVTVRMYV